MSQVTSIREQWSEGKTISEIARAVSVDRNTVYKYTQMTDFSKAVALYVPRGCMLDKHRDEIIAMLKEERKWFHKQRYTAKRILEILKERHIWEILDSNHNIDVSITDTADIKNPVFWKNHSPLLLLTSSIYRRSFSGFTGLFRLPSLIHADDIFHEIQLFKSHFS